ncbi:PalH/RIM21-domain-containing protein [Terfezia claveryi]|nr:PalH/RIM21-domain-containing protein [Terfezia claveryi]
MTLGQRTGTGTIGEVYTPAPLVERMRNHNWRAPPTTLHESQQRNSDIAEDLDAINQDPCLPITITTELTITLPYPSTILVPHTVTYTPSCSGTLPIPTGESTNKTPTNNAPDSSSSDLPASSLREPFYASTIPMAYSIAMTITLSYVLLFLLFLSTPRPWLQKVATLTVVLCLTFALAETTRILALEYSLMGDTWAADTESGTAKHIRERVVAGTEMRVGRIISDTFLWLAQVQTLIRLFPRHREKIIIKWAGFALIVLDTIFSILVHFLSPTTIMSPESFLDAIPALSYLFQIALSLLYAACVVYYSLSSRIRRFSYYHPKAPSNILIAIISLVSVLIPMVFFCLDIGQKDLAAWGDYVRWVGAAAASVVVWEWVDRIERLEREERREGVLGREIFDGDDGLVEDMGISQEDDDCDHRGHRKRPSGGGGGLAGEPAQVITVSGSVSDHTDSSGAVVNRYSRHSVTSYSYETPETATSDPSGPSSVYKSVVRGSPTLTHQQLRATSRSPSAPTADGSDSGGRGSNIGFGDLRRTTMLGVSERSPLSNRTTLSTDDGGDIHSRGVPRAKDSGESEVITVAPSPLGMPDPEKQQCRGSSSKGSGKKDGTWLFNPFKRRQESLEYGPSDRSFNMSKWSSFKPNLSFPLPFLGSLSSDGVVRDSASDKRRKECVGKRQLPVVVIPAPPRGRGISLCELEEARRSGVGDENVRGVGVWTGNSMRNPGLFPNSQGWSEPQPQRFSSSPGYGDQEKSLQERLQQHQLQWSAQQYQEFANRQQQQLSRTTSTAFSTPMQSPPLPPLPPSPAVTATTSSWNINQLPYAREQYTRGSTASPGFSGLSGIYSSPSAPLAVMSGALLVLPPSDVASAGSTPSPAPQPQVVMASQVGSNGSGVRARSRSRSATASAGMPGGFDLVEEGAGSIRSQETELASRSTDLIAPLKSEINTAPPS